VHGDIKPHNVLIFKDAESSEHSAKLIDFGSSTRYANDDHRIMLVRKGNEHANYRYLVSYD
jgi:serine/threonine protein kinase